MAPRHGRRRKQREQQGQTFRLVERPTPVAECGRELAVTERRWPHTLVEVGAAGECPALLSPRVRVDADGSTENVSGQHERPLQVTVIGDHDGGIAVVDEGVSCALASPVNGSTVTWGTGTQRRALGVGAGLGSAPWPLRSGGHHWAWRWFNNRAGGGAERMGPTPPAPRPAAPSEDAHG
jgi:hypothetical protein